MKRAILFLVILVSLSYITLGDISDGINACYSLDTSTYNTTHFSNSIGTNAMKLFNTPTATSNNCKIGQCAQFNYSISNTDYAQSIGNTNISGAAARTINLWIYPTRAGMGTNEKVFVLGSGSDNGFAILRLNTNNNFYFWSGSTGNSDSGTFIPKGTWHMYTMSYDGTNVRTYVNGTLTPTGVSAKSLNTAVGNLIFPYSGNEEGYEGYIDEVMIWGRNLTDAEILDLYTSTKDCGYVSGTGTNPPSINSVNCTSCNFPAGDSIAPYTTTDTTPSFTFKTDINANCRIGGENQNYTIMGGSRNCTSGDGTKTHTCTLTAQDVLSTQPDYVFIGCANNFNGAENVTSTSSPLEIDLQQSSNEDKTEIENGIKDSAIWPGATIYTDQQIYLRDLNNNQLLVTVDKVAVYGNQRWIINHDASTALGLFNITPVVYTFDMVNINLIEIESKVSAFINATKS